MEGKFQDQGQLGQDLEEWFSPIGSQPNRSFFSDEDNQDSIWIEDLAPEWEIIRNQAPEGGKSNMVVVKWLDNMEGSRYNTDYTRKKIIPLLLGQYQIHIPIWIASLRPKRRMIGLSQGINTMKSSRTGKDLSIISKSACRHLRRRERQRIHSPSIQALPSLMAFLGKGSQ